MLLLLQISTFHLFAQTRYEYSTYHMSLPVDNMHEILEDRTGHLWYATYGSGLYRDNGYQVNSWRSVAGCGLADDHIRTICEDKEGMLWLGTNKGLHYFDLQSSDTIKRVSVPPFSEGCITSACTLHDGSVVAACDDAVGCFSREGELLWQAVDRHSSQNKEGKRVNQLYEDSQGTLWKLDYPNGISYYDKQKCAFIPINWLSQQPICMKEDPLRGCYWIGTWGSGVVRAIRHGRGLMTVPSDYHEQGDASLVMDMELVDNGNILLATTMAGLKAYRVSEEATQPLNIADWGVPNDNMILDQMTTDRRGNVWVAGISPHSFLLVPSPQRTKTLWDGKAARWILDATTYRISPYAISCEGNNLWVWQERVGLTCLLNDGRLLVGSPYPTQHELTEPVMIDNAYGTGIYASGRDRLWHSEVKGESIESECVAQLEQDDIIRSLHLDGKNNVIINASKALYRYNTQTRKLELLHKNKESKSVVIDSKGKIREYDASDFTSGVADHDNTIWLGSRNGDLYCQKATEPTPVKVMHIMDGQPISQIVCDSHSHLWMLCAHTVCEYDPQSGKMRSITLSGTGLDVDYFRTLYVRGDSILVGASGEILCMNSELGTTDDKSIVNIPQVSAVVVDGVTLFPRARHQELTPDNHIVEICLSTLDFPNVGRIRYSYRIPEFSNEWIVLPEGSNRIMLTQLPKGKYTIEVKSTDSNGVWSEPVKVLDIERLPAWWETWWAYTSYIIIIFSLSLLIRRTWHFFRQKQEKLLEQLRAKRKEVSLTSVQLAADEKEARETDVNFINRAVALVEKNLSNSEYSVEQFASDMCMTRSNLYVKMQNTANQKPSEFIRNIRLKMAAQMLVKTKKSISEISVACGFSTQNYMGRCFKEVFGMTPSQYQQQMHNKEDNRTND